MFILTNFKKIAYLFVLIGLFSLSFLSSIDSRIKGALPEPVELTLLPIAIAITELQTDESGYAGYNHILDSLIQQEGFNDYVKSEKKSIPHDIDLKQGVLDAQDKNTISKFYLQREDIGIVDYYKLSFSLFGYSTDGLIYLYYSLLALSLGVYAARFLNNFDKLNYLIVFMISHWVVVSVLPSIGNDLFTVYNRRSLPILSIIPAIYIVVSIFENRRLNAVGLIMLIIQAAILIFVFHARSSVAYQFLFIYTAFFFVYFVRRKIKFNSCMFKKSAALSVILVSVAILLLKGYMYIVKDPMYSNYTNGHLFWHPAYLGLSSHSESVNKYGIYLHDRVTGDLVKTRSKERFGTEDWQGLGGYHLFEDIVKEEYLSILKNDPIYVLENYAIKPYLFIKTFFNSHYWLNNIVLSTASIIGTLIGGLLVSSIVLTTLVRMSLLLIGAFSFSLAPLMFLSPEIEAYILEASILLLSLIYWFSSLFIAFFINTIKYMYTKETVKT